MKNDSNQNGENKESNWYSEWYDNRAINEKSMQQMNQYADQSGGFYPRNDGYSAPYGNSHSDSYSNSDRNSYSGSYNYSYSDQGSLGASYSNPYGQNVSADPSMGGNLYGKMYPNQDYQSFAGSQHRNYRDDSVSIEDYEKWLKTSVFTIFLGCPLFGIVALIMCMLANKAYQEKDYSEYKCKIESAKLWNTIGWIAFGITLIAAFFVFFYYARSR